MTIDQPGEVELPFEDESATEAVADTGDADSTAAVLEADDQAALEPDLAIESEPVESEPAEPEPAESETAEPEAVEPSLPLHHPRAVPLPASLTGPRCFTVLPRQKSDEDEAKLVTILEVLAQENFQTVAVHIADVERVSYFADLFVDRITFGVHGVSTAEQHAAAVAAGADFILLITADEALVEAGIAAGICTLPAALTPQEIQQALKLPVAAVQVLPADLLGGNYAESLTTMIGHQPLLVRGGLGGWSAARWYAVGAIACGFDDGLLGDALTGGSLGQLRDRCRTFLTTVGEAPSPITH